jgi:hypothetical protein
MVWRSVKASKQGVPKVGQDYLSLPPSAQSTLRKAKNTQNSAVSAVNFATLGKL